MLSDSNGNMPEWAKWIVCGFAIIGLIASTIVTFGASGPAAIVGARVLVGGLVSGGINAVDQLHDKGKIDVTELVIATLFGEIIKTIINNF